MAKPLITIDIDDVLADTTNAIRLAVNSHLGLTLTPEQYKVSGEYWGYYEYVWREAGIHGKVTLKDIDTGLLESPERISLIAESRSVLENKSQHFRYALVTSRDESWKKATEEWVSHHYGNVFEGLYFTGNRHHETYKSKGELCASLGAKLHIDDNLGHCESVLEQGILTILYGEYGWHANVPEEQTRCRTWQEVGRYLDELVV